MAKSTAFLAEFVPFAVTVTLRASVNAGAIFEVVFM
jgi:hypothetical protein